MRRPVLLPVASRLLSSTRLLSTRTASVLKTLRLNDKGKENHGLLAGPQGIAGQGERTLTSREVATGEVIGKIPSASEEQVQEIIAGAHQAYTQFRHVPAPRRGEILRQVREALNERKEELGALVSLEMGKVSLLFQSGVTPHSLTLCLLPQILPEGIGEVQEVR